MAKTDKSEPTDTRNVQVTLTVHHTHAGTFYKPGERITVTPAQQQWLAARGIIETQETH